NRLLLGNLPLDANEDELADLFEENVGGVSFARCVKDQATGMGKGFAFVVFKAIPLFSTPCIGSDWSPVSKEGAPNYESDEEGQGCGEFISSLVNLSVNLISVTANLPKSPA
ncbi:unnamed protein product, partial [Cylicostephanus goldi]